VAGALPPLPHLPAKLLLPSLPPLPFTAGSGSDAASAASAASAAAAAAAQRLASAAAAAGLPEPLQRAPAELSARLASLLAAAAHARDALLALPETGWAGHDFATLCAAALAACAACALVRPPAAGSPSAAAAGSDLADGYSSPAYAPRPLLGNGGADAGAAAAARSVNAEPKLGYSYDPELVRAYFARRPLQTARRAAEVAAEAGSLAAALLRDRATGRLEANAPLRARQAREAIERLGPAFVKVAQAFSTRVDLLPPDYYREIQKLQDRVPPFPCEEARAAMAEAWGGGTGAAAVAAAAASSSAANDRGGGGGASSSSSSSSSSFDPLAAAEQEARFERRATPEQRRARAAAAVDAVCARLGSKPVAAASLGQVYRATLSAAYGGGEVAIKVQRPGVLEGVCLDLLLVRRAAAWITLWRDGDLPAWVPGGGGAEPAGAAAAAGGADGWGRAAGGSGRRTDWAALVDGWASRFLREMDYTLEAGNARRAALQLAERGVTGVVVPEPVEALTTKQVLVLRWVDGERLAPAPAAASSSSSSSSSSPPSAAARLALAADTRALCATLLNVYLTQLLETGELHADPHVGNLLRLGDGRVAILDWGLTQSVTPRQRAALLSYVAHLTAQDWPNVARDLQALGFIPEDAGDPAEMGLVEPLGRVLAQLSGGGGAAKVNVDAVLGELEGLGKDYPFRVPPFFALVLRAFSLIEGVALAADPDYSIVQECLPYVARRLLTGSGVAALGSADPADRAAAAQAEREVAARAAALEAAARSGGERFAPGEALALAEAELREEDAVVRRALRNVLCGGGARVDPDRLATLAEAFGSFTMAGASATAGPAGAGGPASRAASSSSSSSSSALFGGRPQPGEALPPAVKDALVLAFSSRGTPLQDLLADELAAAADALSRDALGGALRVALGSPPALAAASALQAVPAGVRRALLPAPTPLELLARLQPAVALSEQDREALRTARGVLDLLQRAAAATSGDAAAGGGGSAFRRPPSPAEAADALATAGRVAAELRPLAPGIAPGVTYVAERVARALAARVSTRAREAWGGGDALAAEAAREREAAMAALGFVASDAPEEDWQRQQRQQQGQQQQQQQQQLALTAAAGLGLVAAAPLLLLLAAPLAPLAAAGALVSAAQQQQQAADRSRESP
jgi:aarF domain-containing kinase